MNLATRRDLERFRSAIVDRIGLQFEDAKLGLLEEVLQRRVAQLESSPASYLAQLEYRPPHCELAALAQELTVCETYFFRHNDQFRALADVALPDRMLAREHAGTLCMLSAGCASGEEAYSLAIVAREVVSDPTWTVSIRAVDLNPRALGKAAQARYSPWALRETPPDVKEKWFRLDHRELVLEDRVRRAVQFSRANLAVDDPLLWQSGLYDVIFCRNVLMYFAPEQMRAAIARMAASLAPGGYLFLGHAETLRGISDEFDLCHTYDAFYYRRKDASRRPQPPPDRPASPIKEFASASSLPGPITSWVDAIRTASERVTMLVPEKAAVSWPAPRAETTWQLAPALDLLRHERFAEALDHIRSGPAHAEASADVLLLKAVLLVQAGRVAEAEENCQRLLAADGLNAGAHYVLALCREHAGETARAREYDRLAAHLDPAFAMPRLHCGLLARQAGDRDEARRELTQALLLLEREDVSRLLLFAGGFSRDALIALCQSAITDCGGRS